MTDEQKEVEFPVILDDGLAPDFDPDELDSDDE